MAIVIPSGVARAAPTAPPPTPASLAAPRALRVDGLSAPIGIGVDDVQFSWQVNDPRRGATQRAYRILVTRPAVTGPGAATPLWDSGIVASPDQSAVPYTGPPLAPDAAYQWTVQTWSAQDGPGPTAPPASFETGLTDQDWRAQWIQRPSTDADQYTWARKEFTLGTSPIVRARAYVSADQQYELSINGVRVGKGQAYSFPDTQYYETLDATSALRAGRANAVALLYNWQGATKAHPAGSPGVIAQLSVLHQDGSSELIVTDGSWRVTKAPWLPGTQRDLEGDQVDFTENITGAHPPGAWDQPGFDDRTWAGATVLGPAGVAPWTHLVPVRTRIVEAPVRAVSLTRLANGSVVADFGKVYAAVPTVTFHHGTGGHRVTMHAGYLLDAHPSSGPAGQVSTTHGNQHTDLSYSYVQRGGRETFHPFDYLGFRYLQIDRPGETLHPSDVVALTRHTALPDMAPGTLSSSDPTVNAVFQLGVHSALFTAQEQYIDTPTREKGPWLWDGFNESQTAMTAFGEQNLTRKSLLEYAQSQARYWPQGRINKIYPTGLGAQDINEFTEIYPEWVWQYWLATGDRTLLEAVYPTIANVADYVQNAIAPSTGLVTSLPATNVYYAFPVVTRLNVLGTDVFRRAGDIAAALDRPADEVARQRDRQGALTNAINARLTRPDGIYVDGLFANGQPTRQAAQDSNTAAVFYQVVPANRLDRVAAYVASRGMTNPPRTSAEVLAALRLAGRDRDVVRRLTDRATPGWANILAQGATFTWEVWQPSDVIGDSMSHGWGSNVVVEIRRAVLGIDPTGPGYATFDVTPPRGGLASASGRVPTPRGPILVSWRHGTGSSSLRLTVPANATATVRLAASSPAHVTEGHQQLSHVAGVQVVGSDHGDVVLRVGGGTYSFQAQ